MLAHGGQHHTKEPTLSARDASMVEAEVEFFAFDGAFGTGTPIGVQLPEGGAAAQGREEAIVLAGVSVDGAPVE